MVRMLPKQFSRPQPPASQGSIPQLLQPRHHPPVQPNFIFRSSLVIFGHVWSSSRRYPARPAVAGRGGTASFQAMSARLWTGSCGREPQSHASDAIFTRAAISTGGRKKAIRAIQLTTVSAVGCGGEQAKQQSAGHRLRVLSSIV